MTWKPIETAPRNGLIVDLYCKDGFRCADCSWIGGEWLRNDGPSLDDEEVTHWMNLPKPPEVEQMNLRTELEVRNTRTSFGYSHEAMKHDCYVAHALKKAIQEWWDKKPSESDSGRDSLEWVESRANQIFCEWWL